MEALEIDMSSLASTIKVYEDEIKSFEDMLSALDTSMKTLKSSGWNSGASKQYFSMYNESWKSNLKRHIKIMKHLKSCLVNAQTEYSALYEKVHTLGDGI